ncbi:MAG: LSU ribosomal protein L28p @ LSU ribosomal protein L28p, zinc-dependent, partial [uncultured Nocardioides sp.]
GCRLRHLRQEAGLRQQPSLVAQDHEASLQPQHPARPDDRQRHAEARERLHRLPEGRQGHPL